jgi:hypothetical protein
MLEDGAYFPIQFFFRYGSKMSNKNGLARLDAVNDSRVARVVWFMYSRTGLQLFVVALIAQSYKNKHRHLIKRSSHICISLFRYYLTHSVFLHF